MKAMVDMKVQGYKSQCVGMLIQATRFNGTIVKVNRKSIRVHITESVSTFGKKETSHWTMDKDVTYTYWKTTDDGRELYYSEGKIYGIIEL